MKLVILLTCYVLIFCFSLKAQSESWTVKAGQEIREAISPDVLFRYPKFVTGNVYFKDGRISQVPLNLNLLNEEMQFIDPNGDTLTIANEATLNYISINNDTFYYSKGYLEAVAGNSFAKLGKKQRLKVGGFKKIGGYDQASSASAISSVTSISNGMEIAKMKPKQDILLVKEIDYYIGDKYNYFERATKKNIIKMFGRNEPAIEEFLRDNKIRYNNPDDLKKLIDFLQKTL